MVFNAAKDLVYTINGGSISSGGYRISKILNKKSKKKGKQAQDGGGGGGYSSIFKEDSGIPIGLLLLQRLQYDDGGDESEQCVPANCKNKNKENDETLDENKKLVYASIMAESDDDDDDGRLVIAASPGFTCTRENPIEISSNEIDNELYDSLLDSVSEGSSTPFRKAKSNATKKQNFGKHKDIEKIFQKRRTRKRPNN
jgi:hypothetical protein